VQHLTFQAIAAAAGGLARLAEGGPSQAVRGRVQVEFGAVLSRMFSGNLHGFTNMAMLKMKNDWNMWKMWEQIRF